MSMKYNFNLRVEEVPVLGGFIKNSFIRDQKDFTAYSPDFNKKYLDSYSTKLEAVESLVNPIKLTKELSVITERIYKNLVALRPLLNRLEGYTNRANGSLTIAPKDFGIKEVRAKITSRNVEAVLGTLKVLLENVDNNIDALKAKGFTDEARTEIGNLQKAIKEDNLAQNIKLDEREAHVRTNIKTLNELWEQMSDIMDSGKRIYKSIDAIKAKDYTLTILKKRMSQEGKRKVSEKTEEKVIEKKNEAA
jgi:hypothetical protein